MLEDCVFLSPAPDADLPAVEKAMVLLKGLVGKVDGMIDFASGPNREFENKSGDHHCGFVVTFANRDAYLAYERHPDHVKAGGMLIDPSRGGLRFWMFSNASSQCEASIIG